MTRDAIFEEGRCTLRQCVLTGLLRRRLPEFHHKIELPFSSHSDASLPLKIQTSTGGGSVNAD